MQKLLPVQSSNIIKRSIFVHHIEYGKTKLSSKIIIVVIMPRAYLQDSSPKIFVNKLQYKWQLAISKCVCVLLEYKTIKAHLINA